MWPMILHLKYPPAKVLQSSQTPARILASFVVWASKIWKLHFAWADIPLSICWCCFIHPVWVHIPHRPHHIFSWWSSAYFSFFRHAPKISENSTGTLLCESVPDQQKVRKFWYSNSYVWSSPARNDSECFLQSSYMMICLPQIMLQQTK